MYTDGHGHIDYADINGNGSYDSGDCLNSWGYWLKGGYTTVMNGGNMEEGFVDCGNRTWADCNGSSGNNDNDDNSNNDDNRNNNDKVHVKKACNSNRIFVGVGSPNPYGLRAGRPRPYDFDSRFALSFYMSQRQ